MTTHKPACVADALDRSPGGVLYADADVLFAAPVTAADVGDADVAVTPRIARERRPTISRTARSTPASLYFAATPAARRLVAAWTEACAEGDRTDQKALSDLLAGFDLLGPLGPATRDGLTVLKLDARVFNDTRLKTGRVLHFKNAGRDPRVIAKLDALPPPRGAPSAGARGLSRDYAAPSASDFRSSDGPSTQASRRRHGA